MNTEKTLERTRELAVELASSLMALGKDLTEDQKIKIDKAITRREYEMGLDTLNSVADRIFLPVIIHEAFREVLKGPEPDPYEGRLFA